MISEAANHQRNVLAAILASQRQQAAAVEQAAAAGQAAEIFPHSPTSSFDFAAGYSPAASTAAIGMFDPAGSSPTMQGGAPAPTGRDAFSGTPAQDWGGVFDPSDAATMTAPDMTASPHAAPTFDVDQTGMPNAPSFDNTPAAPDEQGASLTDPGAMATAMAAMTTGVFDPGGWGGGQPAGWGGAVSPTTGLIDSIAQEGPMGVWDYSPSEAPGIPSLTPGVPSDPGVPGSGDLADTSGDTGDNSGDSGDNSGSEGASGGVG